MDRIHQEALGAVQTSAMLGSNVPKMSVPSCQDLNVTCSQERKRHRDEDEVSERDVEAAHPSGHGKLVLTCEVCAPCCRLPTYLHALILSLADSL
jgi:hypothetical protein